jgi:hypothetical protein
LQISIEFIQKSYNNISMENPWASKCKTTQIYIYILLLYKWCVFPMFDVLMWNTSTYVLINFIQNLYEPMSIEDLWWGATKKKPWFILLQNRVKF